MSENFEHKGAREFADEVTDDDIERWAKRIVAEGGERISMNDFYDIYDKQKLNDDRRDLTDIKEKFARDDKPLNAKEMAKEERRKRVSEAVEVTLAYCGETQDWFGENAYLIRTSEYDDVINGVDLVVEFDLGSEDDEPRRVALTVDVTTAVEKSVLEKKIKRNAEKTFTRKGDKKAQIKYFKSEANDYKGPLENIVPIVIGLEWQNAVKLLELQSQLF